MRDRHARAAMDHLWIRIGLRHVVYRAAIDAVLREKLEPLLDRSPEEYPLENFIEPRRVADSSCARGKSGITEQIRAIQRTAKSSEVDISSGLHAKHAIRATEIAGGHVAGGTAAHAHGRNSGQQILRCTVRHRCHGDVQ